MNIFVTALRFEVKVLAQSLVQIIEFVKVTEELVFRLMSIGTDVEFVYGHFAFTAKELKLSDNVKVAVYGNIVLERFAYPVFEIPA